MLCLDVFLLQINLVHLLPKKNIPAKNMKKAIAIIILFLSTIINTQAQDTKVYLSPRLIIGWTFYSGFNYGIDLTIGLFKIKSDNPEINFCISPQYYFVNYKNTQQNIISFNAVIESNIYRIAAGIGQVNYKWGFKGINRNGALGYQFDVSLTTDSKYTPWVQCKTFVLHNGYWEFYSRPYYLSTNIFFRPEPYIVYEKK